MKSDSGSTTSVWMATGEVPAASPLGESTSADVCIVGAGIAGLTTAYMLAREGKSVVVIDDGPIAGGETSRTTAHLVNALDERYYELERLHGENGARLAAESHTEAIDLIEEIITEEKIDCDFERVDGYLFVPPGESTEQLGEETARRASRGTDRSEVRRARAIRRLRLWRGASISFSGAVPHTEVHERPCRCLEEARRSHLYGDACRRDKGRRRGARQNFGWLHRQRGLDSRRDEHAGQRPRRDSHEAGSVPHIRRRSARAGGLDFEDAFVGHARSLSLRSPAKREGQTKAMRRTTFSSSAARITRPDRPTTRASVSQRLEAWTRERFPSIEQFEYRWSGSGDGAC